jgi:hypothetical protein
MYGDVVWVWLEEGQPSAELGLVDGAADKMMYDRPEAVIGIVAEANRGARQEKVNGNGQKRAKLKRPRISSRGPPIDGSPSLAEYVSCICKAIFHANTLSSP